MALEHLFQGSALNAVDAKGRVSMPAAFRAIIDQRLAGLSLHGDALRTVKMSPAAELGCIEVVDASYIESVKADVMLEAEEEAGGPGAKAKALYQKKIFRRLGLFTDVTYDEAGRMVLPQLLRDEAGIEGEAVFFGGGDSFQIWSPEKFAAEYGDVPMLVAGTAGSVSTGAVDPLFAIAEVCREAGAWFHVDGAYGALAAALPGAPHDLRALHLADSLAVDPHKWLYAPLEAGCLLARDPDVLRRAFSYHPAYYHFDDGDGINYVDLGPQNSRGFRALKVWLSLQHAGAEGYRQMIGEDCALAARLHAAAARRSWSASCRQSSRSPPPPIATTQPSRTTRSSCSSCAATLRSRRLARSP